MKLTKTASGKYKLSKKSWQKIGEKAGWGISTAIIFKKGEFSKIANGPEESGEGVGMKLEEILDFLKDPQRDWGRFEQAKNGALNYIDKASIISTMMQIISGVIPERELLERIGRKSYEELANFIQTLQPPEQAT